jgi:hypothetical protein
MRGPALGGSSTAPEKIIGLKAWRNVCQLASMLKKAAQS